MAKTPKPANDKGGKGDSGKGGNDKAGGNGFQMPSDEELEAMFGDDDMMDMTPGEMASATLSTIPAPILAMMGADDKMAALMVAIDPELSLADVDEGLERYEDLLISMLAEVRNQRREITGGPGADNLDARASTIHGKAAAELLESFLEAGDDEAPFLPGVEVKDMRAHLKTLKSRG
jgi:hypothetical protein